MKEYPPSSRNLDFTQKAGPLIFLNSLNVVLWPSGIHNLDQIIFALVSTGSDLEKFSGNKNS